MRRVSINSKLLSVILCIVVICVLTLTLAYAALSVTLNIQGNANIVASSWNLYLDNVKVEDGSVSANAPIVSGVSLSFGAALTNPGDYYEFTVDVVNDGTIDAMINGITKTPELTTEQKKYLNYIVEYENGESITTKQLVESKGLVRLKVKVEFRKDISISDLPSSSMTLNSSFSVNYVQADGSESSVVNDGLAKFIFINGNYDTVGSEACFGSECFYVISSSTDTVTMIAKYNLYAGNECTSPDAANCTPYGNSETGMQSQNMKGYNGTQNVRKGVLGFSTERYWTDRSLSYPADVYDENSILYNYIENYKSFFESRHIDIIMSRVITFEELKKLGCKVEENSCSQAPSWVYSSSYWSAAADVDGYNVLNVKTDASFNSNSPVNAIYTVGIRPVMVVSKDYFK